MCFGNNEKLKFRIVVSVKAQEITCGKFGVLSCTNLRDVTDSYPITIVELDVRGIRCQGFHFNYNIKQDALQAKHCKLMLEFCILIQRLHFKFI